MQEKEKYPIILNRTVSFFDVTLEIIVVTGFMYKSFVVFLQTNNFITKKMKNYFDEFKKFKIKYNLFLKIPIFSTFCYLFIFFFFIEVSKIIILFFLSFLFYYCSINNNTISLIEICEPEKCFFVAE